jgi:predicted DsbA family dithiol-disulfide isomerase
MAEHRAAPQHAPRDPQDLSPGDESEHAAPQQDLTVTFVADLVCPWCRLALHTLLPVAERLGCGLRWHPFLLNPGLPPEGVPRGLYLERKFGSPEAAAAVLRRVARRGRLQGLDFAFARIASQPDTVPAHALLLEAERAGRLGPLALALFERFFEAGEDLSDPALLAELAERAGLGPEALAAALSPDRHALVRAAHRRAVAREIDGVPAFLLPGVGLLAGAQPAEALTAFLELGLLTAAG